MGHDEAGDRHLQQRGVVLGARGAQEHGSMVLCSAKDSNCCGRLSQVVAVYWSRMCTLPRHRKQSSTQEGTQALHGQGHGVIEDCLERGFSTTKVDKIKS